MPETDALVSGAITTLVGLAISTGFLLALFVGFVVVAGFSKLRKTGRDSLVHRNLVDRMDQSGDMQYLAPDAPRGPADQLRTPELLEQSGRKD